MIIFFGGNSANMPISDKELAAMLRTHTHTDEIDTDRITPGDHIDPELVDDGMLLHDSTDDDGMQIGMIETDGGHLIRAHRPGDEFEYADEPPAEYDPEWIVDRAGDFSDTDEIER